MKHTILPIRRSVRLVILFLVLGSLLSACSFVVQPIEEHRTEDGYMSLTFPASWDVMESSSDDGLSMVAIAENPMNLASDELPEGASAIVVMLMPDFFPGMGIDMLKLSPEEYAGVARAGMAEDGNTNVGELEQVTLPAGQEAYRFQLSDSEFKGFIYIYPVVESLMAMGVIVEAIESEESPTLEAIAEDVFSSVKFRGDVESYLERIEGMSMFGF